jgi:hypothetical protein
VTELTKTFPTDDSAADYSLLLLCAGAPLSALLSNSRLDSGRVKAAADMLGKVCYAVTIGALQTETTSPTGTNLSTDSRSTRSLSTLARISRTRSITSWAPSASSIMACVVARGWSHTYHAGRVAVCPSPHVDRRE